ncbi:MAG TPA: histidine kinase [Flavisolibacter sp.]|nr:histidine kinase [Flavisolibacter sp.]
MKAGLGPTRLQVFSFLASMPVIDFVLNYILYDDALFQKGGIWLYSYPLIFLIGIGSWRLQVGIQNFVQYKFPAVKQTRTRVLLLTTLIIPFMSGSVALIFIAYNHFHVLGYSLKPNDIEYGMLVGLSVNLIFVTLYEVDYVVERFKESLLEKETLKQQALQHEFDSLKNQVNPHFLFNCFNTLSSLITEDKEKAGVFLNELSKVYRYLLRNNEDGVSTVENEIRFIRSYYGLLKTRHGDAVQMTIEIDKRYNPYLLPSLTLQLLVENVVKHNQLAKSQPLVIEIFTTAGNKLVVNNNLQRRTVKAPSNKVGLENIKAKYNLLNQPGFQIMEDGKNFTVVLPLIWNNSVSNNHLLLKENKTT